MFYNNEKEFDDFLIKYNINNNQFDILWKMYKEDYASIYRKFNQLKRPGTKISLYVVKEDLEYLLNIKLIEIDSIKSSKFPDPYKLTKGFFEKFTIETGAAFDELYNTYPEFLFIQGERINAKGCDYDDLQRVYGKKINLSTTIHFKIITELKNQIDLKLVNMKLENWIRGESWRLNTVNKESVDINIL